MFGGVAWLVKIAWIWADGGAHATEGVAGFLFTLGAVTIVLAVVIRAWHAPPHGRSWQHALAAVVAVVAFALLVNVPILVGWQLFGRTWYAEEVGVLLTALLAVALGGRWVRGGIGRLADERVDEPGGLRSGPG